LRRCGWRRNRHSDRFGGTFASTATAHIGGFRLRWYGRPPVGVALRSVIVTLALVTPPALLALPFVWLAILTAGFTALFSISPAGGPRRG
jgi:hypothetical protein